MKLDLSADIQKIRRFIEKRVATFNKTPNLGPGEAADPIALITFGYYIDQTGYFAMVFDTRPEADNDGSWTLHIENEVNVLPFPKWEKAAEKISDGDSVQVTLSNGETQVLDENDDSESMAKLFGEQIKEVILGLRKEGTFAQLPLSKEAFFSIEDFDGSWGWPPYEKRKKLGKI